MDELREKIVKAIRAAPGGSDAAAVAALRAIEEAGYAIVPKTAGQRLIDSAREQSEKMRTYSAKAAVGDSRNLEEPRG